MTGATPPRDRAPYAICCDLDGVLWRGDEAVAGSADAVAELRAGGLRVAFFSNNSSQSVTTVIDKLARFGIPATDADVLTSALAATELLRDTLPAGSRVLACAGAGVIEALERAGFAVVREAPAAAVVVGWHRDFDFDGLARASEAVRAGARLVATNVDATYPVAEGMLPGAGALVAAVATASGARPEVAGKPEPAAVALVRSRLGHSGVIVGDRPSTDGALAHALGWPYALVLSGVTADPAPAGGEAVPVPAPPVVGRDLSAIVPDLVALGSRRGGDAVTSR